jgi:hypothetical protein
MSGEGWHPVHPITDLNKHAGPLGLTKRELFAVTILQGIYGRPFYDHVS